MVGAKTSAQWLLRPFVLHAHAPRFEPYHYGWCEHVAIAQRLNGRSCLLTSSGNSTMLGSSFKRTEPPADLGMLSRLLQFLRLLDLGTIRHSLVSSHVAEAVRHCERRFPAGF
jgi:hypothetical protein